MQKAAVVLAAGEGKRMKSRKPKVMHEVLFKPMIDWVIDAAAQADISQVCAVTGPDNTTVAEHLAGRCETVVQPQRLGTAHAVMQAADFLRREAPEDVVVLCGDAPFIGGDVIAQSYRKHKESGNALTVITAHADDPFGYGRIVRDGDGNVRAIVEEKDATADEKRIDEINSGAYWFRTDILLRALADVRCDNAQGEYYLTDTVAIVRGYGLKSGTCELADRTQIAGANDRIQLAQLNTIARDRVLERLMREGVTVADSAGVLIGPDVRIGCDTAILPGTIITGRTVIGEDCVVGPNSLLEDCELGDAVRFNASQAYRSKIGNGVTIGPFVHIRPGTTLHEGVHVGDFVEIKNSEIGIGSKVPHLTYVGDSDVGSHVNFGCGCVTSNYDGVRKYRTTVEDHAFIGCNTNLIAPVRVGKNAYTAAGSTITRDVPADALAVARSRQQNIEGWVTRRRPPKNGQ